MEELKKGIYRHFKNNLYLVEDVATNSEGERCVIYKALYDDCKTYIRPLNDFTSEIDVNREDNVTHQTYRFELIEVKKNSI